MSTNIEIKPTNFQSDEYLGKTKIGSRRSLEQIYDTFIFELQRNFKRALILLGVIAVFFVLQYYLNYQTEQNSIIDPHFTPISYVQAFMGFIGIIILIIVIGFGAQMLVVDFEQETGNLLFPKIARGRLMTGRFIAQYTMIIGEICIFYLAIATATLIKFNAVPKEIWFSMGWSFFYAFMLLSMTVLFSSFMKRSAGVIVVVLILMLIGFDIVQSILSFTVEVEPLFLPSDHRYIITSSLAMPEDIDRKTILRPYAGNPDLPDIQMILWSTPSYQGAAIGLAIFSLVFLIGAFFIYRYCQDK